MVGEIGEGSNQGQAGQARPIIQRPEHQLGPSVGSGRTMDISPDRPYVAPQPIGGDDALRQFLEKGFKESELNSSREEFWEKIGERMRKLREHRPTMQRSGGVESWTDEEFNQFRAFLTEPLIRASIIQGAGDVLRLSGYYSDQDIKNIEDVLEGKKTQTQTGGEMPPPAQEQGQNGPVDPAGGK